MIAETHPTETEKEVAQAASEISLKIKSLCNFDGEDLKGEMASLKKALLENPAACSLLHPEDIGEAVANLRRMVGIAVASAVAKPKKEKAAGNGMKKLTAAELKKAMAEVSDDDF